MLPEELTADLRHLAAELDALGKNENASPPAFPPISDFEPVTLLGCGGMGAVYVARQISLERDVAIKVVSAGNTVASRPDEARTVAQLHHPNIVQVFSAGRDGDTAWFAMELVKGESAEKRAFSSMEEVARVGIAVAEALAYAHRCGILHRDVKPSNIFISEDGMVKLGDFGLACLAAERITDKSGTKRYMAPEVLDGGEVSAASDQYALGVTLRELAERLSRPQDSGGPQSFAAADAQNRVPPDFTAILSKATAHESSDRYESVEAMLADLRRFLAHAPVVANPPSPLRRFRLFARRNPLAAFGIVAAVFCLVAFVAALAVGYVKTTRALEATHQEAARAAQSLAATMTNFDRSERDPRDTELRRALEVAESLAARFPDDETIKASVEAIRKARERRANLHRRPRRYRLLQGPVGGDGDTSVP